jgi:GTPase SAR1 family protein
MVGDGSTGKTCLMKRYVNNQFDEDYNLTMGKKYLLLL